MSGARIGPYLVGRTLGAGAMGTVHEATVADAVGGLEPGDRVALKVVHPHLVRDERFLRRFEREAAAGKRIVHANVVRTLDAGVAAASDGPVPYLAMELVAGQTLRGLLDEFGLLPEEFCRHVGIEVAKGLSAIHAAGVVHRDLKPENVLVTSDHEVKLMDLGIARIADASGRLSQSGAFVGSAYYAAPEQFRGGGAIDGRADLHALGAVLHEAACGRRPFAGGDFASIARAVLHQTPRRLGDLQPQISPFFEEVVCTLLRKGADERFGSAAELARVLAEGERSAWWRERARRIRTESSRPLRRIRIERDTALHGRDAELARLRALFDAVRAGDGRVALVEGEAGVGKSRLVDEFAAALERDGEDLDFLFGSFVPGGSGGAGAFGAAFRERLGEDDLDTALQRDLGAAPGLVPGMAALLRGEPPPEGRDPLPPESVQTAFVHLARSLAAVRPVVIFADDLHHAPAEGRALFTALARALTGHRVLLVGALRSESADAWVGEIERAGAARIPLGRLGPKDVGRLLVEAFRSERLADELGFRIATKSDGNPFFVFEILRSLRDGSYVARGDDGTWAATQAISEIRIPSSVLEVVQARVAALAPEERDLLDVASCLGFEFDPILVGEVLGVARIPTLKRLAQIERGHRLVRSAGERFVFDHHQVQEALYASIPELLRREYHASIGETLERRAGAAATLPGAACVELSSHFLRAARPGRARPTLRRALAHLQDAHLHEVAVDLIDLALGAGDGDGPSDGFTGDERADLLLSKAYRLSILGDPASERDALDEASRLAESSQDAALRVRVKTDVGWFRSRTAAPDAVAALEGALASARDLGDRACELKATARLAAALWNKGDFEASRAFIERQIELARELGRRNDEATATANLGAVLWSAGLRSRAAPYIEQAVGLARALGDRRFEATATANLGLVAIDRGRLEEAWSLHEKALAIAREIGDRRAEIHAAGNAGATLRDLGRLAEAQARHELQLALARETGHVRAECSALGNLGIVRRFEGRAAEARALHERQLALARASADGHAEVIALGGLGQALADLGDPDGAREAIREAIRLADARNAGGSAVWIAASLHELERRHGTAAAADAELTAWEERARAADDSRQAAIAGIARGTLPGASPAEADAAESAFAELDASLDAISRIECRLHLHRATGRDEHLHAAVALLRTVLAHAPPEWRTAMLRNVHPFRDAADAAAAAGIAVA